MKEKVTAIISFLSGIGWGIFGLYLIYEEYSDREYYLIYFTLLISAISTVLYVIWTKFGNKKFSDLEKLDYENQILKRQIEQKELKKKLEE